MIRGAQKKMIVIRTHDSRVFEEAYFVMRRDSETVTESTDMLAEADRIIRRSTGSIGGEAGATRRTERLKARVSRLCWLGTGLLLGSGGTALLFWLL